MGSLLSTGLLLVFDGQARFMREGLQAFLRLQNFASSGDFQEVGVPWAPTGTVGAEGNTGFTDILIDPPPQSIDIPDKDIGLSGGKLMFGARKFIVSDTFVQTMLDKYPNVLSNNDVWRRWDGNTPVVGIIYGNQIFSIEDILQREVAGRIISWTLNCNATESQLTDGAQEVNQP